MTIDPSRIQTTRTWRAKHREHLLEPGDSFNRLAFPHPSGSWYWLVCVCGAKHLTSEAIEANQ